MGILDDAIREHLELKRSHGASEDEIRRKETEVFGAARQEVAPEAPPEEHTQLLQPEDAPVPDSPEHGHVTPGDAPIPDPHDHAHPVGSDPAWGEDTELFSEPVHAAHEPEPSPAAEAGAGTLEPTETQAGPPVHHHEDEQHPALVDHDHIGGEEHPPEPVFRHAAEAPTAPPPESPVEEPPVEEPPVEEPPVEEPGEGDEDDDEDVLEETPEFLQDAPEHDRLWFEQKPPRDFDFGE
jgi:hypothetical protein